MLTAIRKDNNKKYSTLRYLKETEEDFKKYKWKCETCKEDVIHVKESINYRIEHFRHQPKSLCDHSSESEEHMNIKKYLFIEIQKYNKIT